MKMINSIVQMAATLFCIILLSSCSPEDYDSELLLGSWTHSIEEDMTGQLVYRSGENITYPSIHYRHSFSLMEESKCIYLVLAANDAHFFTEGNWYFDSKSGILTIEKDKDIIYEYEVLELDEGKMILRQLL